MENTINSVAGILVIACGLLFWLIRIANEINEKLAKLLTIAPEVSGKLGRLEYIQDNVREIWLIAKQR